MKKIDFDTWERKEIFNFFQTFDCPRYSVTLSIDCTNVYAFCKEKSVSFFLVCLYIFLKANNDIPSFRLRTDENGDVIDLETVNASTAILKPKSELFKSVYIPFRPTLTAFIEEAEKQIDALENQSGLPSIQRQKKTGAVSITCSPWYYFEGISLPYKDKNQAMPIIAFGKFKEENARKILPYALQVHHSFIDGLQVGQFVSDVEEMFAHPEKL